MQLNPEYQQSLEYGFINPSLKGKGVGANAYMLSCNAHHPIT